VQRTLISSPLAPTTSPSIQAISESSIQTWVPTMGLAAAAYNTKHIHNYATRVKLKNTWVNGKDKISIFANLDQIKKQKKKQLFTVKSTKKLK